MSSMPESEEHKYLKKCAIRMLNGQPEKVINGIVDVKTPGSCVEIELSGRRSRLEHAIKKLSSSPCNGGVLIVPQKDLSIARSLADDNIEIISNEMFSNICQRKNIENYKKK